MAYSTNAQVASEFKGLTFGSGTKITDTEVDRFIEEADAEIDSILSNKYVVPITGTTSLILVRQISIWLVAQRVKDIMIVKTGANESDQGIKMQNRLDSKARKMLQDIIAEKINLPDATLLDDKSGVYSYNYQNDIEQQFERDTEQW